jgi:hypothetical protein
LKIGDIEQIPFSFPAAILPGDFSRLLQRRWVVNPVPADGAVAVRL